MLGILLGVLTFALILVSLFLILVVLAQKSKSDGGIGAAMGGGMAEATFGAETSNVLTKLTIYSTVLFFLLALILYVGNLYRYTHQSDSGALPAIPASTSLPPVETPAATTSTEAPAATPPATTTPAAPAAPAESTPAPATPTAPATQP